MKLEKLNLERKLGLITPFIVIFLVYLFLALKIPWNLVFSPTTLSGGDTGSHNYIVYYLKEIFPKIKWWSPDWYAGFPFLYFYPPLLYVLAVLLSYFISLNIAFKIVTLLGTFLLPLCVFWALKILKENTFIALMASVLMIGYLFLEQFSMYGGNLPSTLAGEFSYSFSFALFFVFWALLARDISVFDFRFKTPLVIILSIMSLTHPFPVIVSVIASLILIISRLSWLRKKDKRKVFLEMIFYLVKIYGFAFCLTAFWSLPFLGLLGYTSKMKWFRFIQLKDIFPPSLIIFELFGILGLIWIFLKNKKEKNNEGKSIYFVYPLIGALICYLGLNNSSIWNARFLPFILVILLIFSAFCFKEALVFIVSSFKNLSFKERKIKLTLNLFALSFSLVYLFILLPKSISYIPFWLKWNYEGFEKKPGYYQLKELTEALKELPYGRIMWEYRNEYDKYFGTPRVLENIPIWSKKPTFEGLLIESAISGYFHFINQAETTETPTSAISGLKYPPFDFEKGVSHLKTFGANYFLAYTPSLKSLANQYFQKIKDVNDFSIYKIENSELVELVKDFQIERKNKNWIDRSINWYTDEDLDKKIIFLTPKQEKEFKENINKSVVLEESRGKVEKSASIEILKIKNDSLTFKTTALGAPHIIKISYFPSWKVKGALGPYLISPSFMVVIPLEEKVELIYDYGFYDKVGFLLSFTSLFVLTFQKPFRFLKPLLRNLLKLKD
ncbi:MAG: hypothetical protein AB7D02_00920 [Candidatus Paceibacterota bacterium]